MRTNETQQGREAAVVAGQEVAGTGRGLRGRWPSIMGPGRAALAAAAIGLTGVGCGAGILCPTENRSVSLEGHGTAGPATTRVLLNLYEHQGGTGNGQFVTWFVEVLPYPVETVAGVRLRAGVPGGSGAVLYDLPLWHSMPEFGKVTYQDTMTPYQGTISFDAMWDQVQGAVYVEVVFEGGRPPIGIGPLQVTNKLDWYKACD